MTAIAPRFRVVVRFTPRHGPRAASLSLVRDDTAISMVVKRLRAHDHAE